MRLLLFLSICFSSFGQINLFKPKERAVYQRNNANSGWIEVRGNINEPCQSIEARLVPMASGQGNETGWQAMVIKNNGFTGRVYGSGGFYRVEIKATTTKGAILNKQVERVGIGEVFLVSGQSNTMIPGPLATDERVEAVSYTFGLPDFPDFIDLTNRPNGLITKDNKWIYPSVSVGAFCGSLGDLLVKKLNVPVLFMVAAMGGTTVEYWNASIKTGEAPYKDLNTALNKFARAYGLRGILWHQGETNSIYKPTPAETYKSNLTEIINRSRVDLAYQQLPWVVARVSWSKYQVTGPTDPSDPNPLEFRNETLAGQNGVIASTPYVFAGPETDQIEGYYQSAYRHDGVHFSDLGQTKHGELWNQKLDNYFFSASQPFTDYTEILGFQSIFFSTIESKTIQSGPFYPNAKASSGLPISFRVVSGPAIFTDGAIKLTGQLGTVVIEAIQSGNEEYQSTSLRQSFQVLKSPQNINFPTIESKVVNAPNFALNANASSGLPIVYRIVSGPATIENGQIKLTGQVGTVVVEAIQAGNEAYEAAVLQRTFQVQKNSQNINFPLIEAKNINSAAFNLNASASSGLPIIYKIISGPARIETNTVVLNGSAGKITIEAVQVGNDIFSAAPSIQQVFEVFKLNQTIVFENIVSQVFNKQVFSLNTTSSSGLAINLKLLTGSATLNGNQLTVIKPSKISIEASQAGNERFMATNTTLSFEITKVKQEINFKEITPKFHTVAPFELQASTNSGLEIGLTLIAGPAKLNNKILELTGQAGKVIIEANQKGDDFYEKAEAKRIEFEVIILLANEKQSPFIVYPNPANNTVFIQANQRLLSAALINEIGVSIPQNLVLIDAFKYQIDVRNIPAGLYFLKTKTIDNQHISKIIINH